MPYSYSQPSTSGASWNSGEANADANWGVPVKCFCGKPVKLEVCKTGYRQGDRVYKCSMLKWWDQAVTEELEKVNHSHCSALRHGQLACNHALESVRETVRLMQGEIETLTERLLAKEVEIDRLRALLSTW
ncbi:unnamed protein product [Arabidopsis thaliana]|uniref:(thale cress) hypothetical protein n=1 Tax=Arabidopsis thaliana TaxID=3702 RepID=A0A7G2E930_ARATH|nr:unnamed protein product [Arabidopsis thaliana]